jgi:predicted AAA+ superfamily ATPase
MQRSIRKQILEDLKKKIVFIVGPRQVGKTWLAKDIMHAYKNPLYLNYDNLEHRNTIKNYGWLSDVDLVVFDELHKMPKWKTYIKGVFDTKRDGLHILVTGSARMDAFRKAGDSLAGRFFVHHLLPFSLAEIDKVIDTNTERIESELNSLDLLLERSGFPEPLLATDGEEAVDHFEGL